MMFICTATKAGVATRFQFGCSGPALQTGRLLAKMGYLATIEDAEESIQRDAAETKRAEEILMLLYTAPEGEA